MERKMAVGTGSHFTCQSFLFAKPNCFRKTQAKIQSLGACWVCRYNFTTGAVCGQCTGWEAPRRSGELHSSIPIAQGAQWGQKTNSLVMEGACKGTQLVGEVQRTTPTASSFPGSDFWGSGLSAQSHREQMTFCLWLF